MPRKLKCECGGCHTCHHRRYMREWYRRPENTERVRAWQRQYRQDHLEEERERDRRRGFRSPGAEKVRARHEVSWALADGTLVKQPCEVCGDADTEAHHDDYSKSLDVRWLCHVHHGQIHQRVNPRPLSASQAGYNGAGAA